MINDHTFHDLSCSGSQADTGAVLATARRERPRDMVPGHDACPGLAEVLTAHAARAEEGNAAGGGGVGGGDDKGGGGGGDSGSCDTPVPTPTPTPTPAPASGRGPPDPGGP